MKLLVDKMPGWRGDCPFVKETWYGYEYAYICKLIDKTCDLSETKENECQMLKQLKIRVIN